MKIKHYKLISNLVGVTLGAFILSDVLNYPFLFEDLAKNPIDFLIPQGIYVLGLVCLIACYATILQTIKKKGVFTVRNEKTFQYFGVAILVLGVTADVLFKNTTEIETSAPRILAFLGGTLVFVSLIFKIGIKMQEEQDLTI